MIVQLEPNVQETVLTVTDGLTRSALVTSPVAVNAVVTAKLAAGYSYAVNYSCGAGKSYPNAYRSTFKNSGPKTTIRGLPNGAGWQINGRLYSNDGTPIDGFGRPLLGKKAEKARRVWQAVKRRAGKSTGEALTGSGGGGWLNGVSRPAGRSYTPVRCCPVRSKAHEGHAWGDGAGSLWCPGSDGDDSGEKNDGV